MNKAIVFSVLLISLFLFGCVQDNSLAIYGKLQERLVDREEELRMTTHQNLQLNAELAALQEELVNASRAMTQQNIQKQEIRNRDVPSPSSRITDQQIKVTDVGVRIDLKNAQWWYVLDTKSMDPLLDVGSTVITVPPTSAEDIHVGDIIVFHSDRAAVPIVHRVMNVSRDDSGIYYVTKGDNNALPDVQTVRYPDVIAIVVSIVY